MLRTFERTDQDAVAALIQAGMRDRWGETYDPTMNADTDDLWGNYVEPGHTFVVAEADNVVVGCGVLLHQPDGSARIVRMSTHDRYRRQGIARRIVHSLVATATEAHLTPIRVLTDKPWTDAVALYESCGFVIVGHDDIDTHLEYQPQ